MKKALAFAVVAMLSLSFFIPTSKTHAIEKIDPEIIKMGLASNEIIPVFVELEGRTVVDALTFDGKKPFANFEIMHPNNLMRTFTLKKLDSIQESIINTVKRIVPDASVGMTYQYVFNGFYAELPVSQVVKIADLQVVKGVLYSAPQYPNRTRSRVFLGAEKTWATVRDPKDFPVNGNGILVGVTDSGLDYTHVDFGGQTKPAGSKVVISNDLAYKDNDCQEEENPATGGHGTACAGIIAGDGPQNPKTKVQEKGIAPKAKLAGFKIGMRPSDGQTLSGQGIMKSWEQNVTDKIHVSNNSYGAPGGYSVFNNAQNKCVLAGVSVIASQGNNGSPGPGLEITSGSTASPVNVLAVASLDDTDASKVTIIDSPDQNLNGKVNTAFIGNNGKSFTGTGLKFQVLDCGWGRTGDFNGLDVKGKIALIQRGPNPALGTQYGPPITFKEKCVNAANAGAKGVLMYNYNGDILRAAYYESQKNETPSQFNFIPSLELYDYRTGIALRDAIQNGKEWTLGTPNPDQNKVLINVDMTIKGNLADYTSGGPTVLGYLKPDVAAPGEFIHTTQASYLSKGKNDTYTETFNGTSAAGPMVAGCSALVRQARPHWNAFEVKRALMNTSEPLKRYLNDYYIPMIFQGQGRVNANFAATTPILFNPPSALILSESGKANVTDPPSELFDEEEFAKLPEDVQKSKIPVKVANYSNKAVKISLSFEINSARPDQFNINLTNSDLTIPPADKKGVPGLAWFGVSVDLPKDKLKGFLNDIYIWATDKTTNKKWHIGICVYNNNPQIQGYTNTYASYIDYDKNYFTPNEDGENDKLRVNFEVTNGSIYANSYYTNFARNIRFWVVDQNDELWTMIYFEPYLEIGPYSFEWDGKDQNGKYILPDGDWSLVVTCTGSIVQNRSLVDVEFGRFLRDSEFSVDKSLVQSLPILTTYVTPAEPGVGQMFEVGVFLKNARSVKSLQFKIHLPNSSDIVQYMGYSKGDFLTKDEPLTIFTTEYDKDKEVITVDIQRPLEGVSGEGWVLYLKFLAKEMNFFDIRFSDVNLSMVDDTMKEVKAKAFFKNTEVSVYKESYSPADFNHDSKVDDLDLGILLKAMGTKDGDSAYNWRCDLNFDLAINVDDYALFSKSYSKR